MRVYVTFGGRAYDATLERIDRDGVNFGADDVWVYDDAWVEKTTFRKTYHAHWEHPGFNGVKYGYGWYCWKPFIIDHALSRLASGDLLLYTDGDTYPIADFSRLYEHCICEEGFFLFEATGCSNRQWVKRDCLEIVDPSHFIDLDSQHATARFMVFQKGKPGVHSFLHNWLRFVTDIRCVTRDPSVLGPEHSGFTENRGDQSVFSVLAQLYKIPLHREADAFGANRDKDWDLYPQLFEQVYCQGDRTDLSGSRFANIPK